MCDLTTSWLGLTLKNPLVLAASPLSKDPDAVAIAVESGASAVIMHSLFEEQLVHDQMSAHHFFDTRTDLDAESSSVLPAASLFSVDVEPYLAEIERLRKRVDVPIIASLNGTTPGGWVRYAEQLESAGVAAIELNLYDIATSANESGAQVEQRQLEVVHSVTQKVKIPVNVKLSPFYSSLLAFVRGLAAAGAKGVTVFNRYYQPDISLDTLDVERKIVLSTSADLTLRLHTLALLSPTTQLSLSCSGGVHSGLDAAKAVLGGAHTVQLASVLLAHGPQQLKTILDDLRKWLSDKGYNSSAEARGVLNYLSAPDPHAWERLNYAQLLQSWNPSARLRSNT
jgi:dihydroorotate dehydrogenase (fumarate)